LGVFAKPEVVFLGSLQASVEDGADHAKQKERHGYLKDCLKNIWLMHFLDEFALLAQLITFQVCRERRLVSAAHPRTLP
jgi:hypothetical protein